VDDKGSFSGKGGCSEAVLLFASAARPTSEPNLTFCTVDTGREAVHSSLSNAEDKNACSYTSILPYVFMVWCLVKHRNILSWLFLPCIPYYPKWFLSLFRTNI
jgi:hypothetical protein